MDRELAHRVLRTIKQRTNLLTINDVMIGTNRLQARGTLHGVTLNVPGVVVYLSGYSIERVGCADEHRDPEFVASNDTESGPVREVAQQLLGLSSADAAELFGYPTRRAVLAAFEQLAGGADQVNWSKIPR